MYIYIHNGSMKYTRNSFFQFFFLAFWPIHVKRALIRNNLEDDLYLQDGFQTTTVGNVIVDCYDARSLCCMSLGVSVGCGYISRHLILHDPNFRA